MNYNSQYFNLANTTLKWLSSDTEELYQKNLKENYNLLLINGWIKNTFTYTFNKHGFRCSNFMDENNIMFLGCSNTMGIGIPEEQRWTDIVSLELSLNCVNLGIAGGSADTCFRLCHGWIDRIKPKIVIFSRPPGIRLELISTQNIDNYGIKSHYHDLFFNKWAMVEDNNSLNYFKNQYAISYMCNLRQIKFVNLSSMPVSKVDKARDLLHEGVRSNLSFAKKVLTEI